MKVMITRGYGKGLVVPVSSRWPYGIEVTSPGGREWTLNDGDYVPVTDDKEGK